MNFGGTHMKKNRRFSKGVVAILGMLTFSLAGCGDSLFPGGGGGDPGQQNLEEQIREIYNLYVESTIAAGQTPKSYEEWLESIKGPQGEPGQDGTSLLTGNGAPSSNLGKTGDSYIDLLTWDYYVKNAQGWSKAGNLKGSQGEPGTSFRTGYGVPSSSLGIDGDSYLNLSNYDLYVKSNGEWILVGNISGGGSQQETYVITYVANGGSGSMEQSIVHSSNFILPECGFVPALGEKFTHWTINGAEYQPAESITLSGDITVTANYEVVPYTLSVAVGEAHPYPGEEYSLTVTCSPEVALSDITVSSSNTSVLTIASNKKSINTKSAGESTITASYEIGRYKYSETLKVTVYEKPVVFTPVTIDFYAFNDMHGAVTDSKESIGLERTTTLLKNLTNNQNAVLVSQGDMWQGSCESNSTRGELVTKWMKQLGFASMTLGNHEYDWGKQYIKSNAAIAGFPTLGINVIDNNTHARADYVEPSVVVEKAGVKIGIIGAIGDCWSSISSRYVNDVTFLQEEDLSNLVKAESTRLRKEGCDFIVYSVHDGNDGGGIYSGYDSTLSSGGYVDVVFEGHSHSDYRYMDDSGIWHIQSAGYNKTFNNISFEIDPSTGEKHYVNNHVYNTIDYDYLTPDATTTAIFKQYDFASFYTSIGINNTGVKGSRRLKQDIANLYLQKGLAKWSSRYSIVLGGGYISCRDPYQLDEGEVTYAQLYNLFPFDNDIVLGSLDGDHLKRKFIETSNDNYFMAYNPDFDLSSVQDDQIYYIVTDTFSSDYAPNAITEVATYSTEGIYQRDLLREYIASGAYYQEDVPIPDPTKGTALNPYTIDEAYEMCTNSYQWGWFKGKVSNLERASVKSGYMQDVYFKDENGTYSVRAYKIYEYDGASSENAFLQVGDEVLFYGALYFYNSLPQFGGTTVAVSVNGGPTCGLSNSMPASICQYCMMEEAKLQAGQYVSTEFVKGQVTNLSLVDASRNMHSITIQSKTVNNAYQNYEKTLTVYVPDQYVSSLAVNKTVIVRIDTVEGLNTVTYVE